MTPPGAGSEEPAHGLSDHWGWRPEWTPERTCLYWYLTFRETDVDAVLGPALLVARREPWIDTVPARWCHVTVADAGFTDELAAEQVQAVQAEVAAELTGEPALTLDVGPAFAGRTAVMAHVAPATDRDGLAQLRDRVEAAQRRVLGADHAPADGRPYRPHTSIGYVHRTVDADDVTALMGRLPEVRGRLDVDALTLAAVTRRAHSYRWEVRDAVRLGS